LPGKRADHVGRILSLSPASGGAALERPHNASFASWPLLAALRESCMPEIGTYSLSGGRRLARQRASSDPTDLESPFASRSRTLDHTTATPEETYQNGHKSHFSREA